MSNRDTSKCALELPCRVSIAMFSWSVLASCLPRPEAPSDLLFDCLHRCEADLRHALDVGGSFEKKARGKFYNSAGADVGFVW